jgi:pimeloyl-ACP methyl ester carboxylesterase
VTVDEPRVVQIAKRRVRILDSGVGKTVLVLHGWGGRIESMAPVIQCLVPRFRVVALDLPGFGESPRPDDAWGTPEYAAFVRAVMEELGIESAHFVGHSYGAKTSLQLAATHPELVVKLVAVGSSGLRSAPSLRSRLKRSASRFARLAGRLGPPGRALKDAVYRRVASSDYREAAEMRPILVRVVNEDLSALLPQIKASTLLVWGSNDDAVPLAHARTMERLIPDAGLVILEGAGHFAYLDEPDRFCRVVRHFFDETNTVA